MNYDMTGVDENMGFKLLPEGLYDAKILNVEEGISKNDDPIFAVTFEIQEGEHKGRFAWDRILFPKPGSSAIKIRGRSMHFLHVIGEPYEGKINIAIFNWIGKRCKIFVQHEVYEGKTYARVQGHDFAEQVTDTNEIPF